MPHFRFCPPAFSEVTTDAINGTVVNTMPKTGAIAKTDGVYGMRINHQLDVQIDGFALSKM